MCNYLADWVSIKARWSLTMDQSEHGRIRNLLTYQCPNQTIAAWPTTPAPQPPDPDPPPSVCDPSYPTVCIPPPPPDLDCGDIVHRNFTVIGADPHRFDGNNDGIGCQS